MARRPAPLSPCVCNTLRMATRVGTQLYDDVLRPSGLRVTQFSMLAAIARLEEANLRQLEEALAIDQTTLTRSLGVLERDGLTERVAHPDRRIKAMRLTPRGRVVLRTARPLWSRGARGGRTRAGVSPTSATSRSGRGDRDGRADRGPRRDPRDVVHEAHGR